MLTIILSVILAVVISFLVTMDAGSAKLYTGTEFMWETSMFIVVLASIIVGMLLAGVKTIVNLITSKLTIMGKNSDLKKSYKSMNKLQEKVEKLEGENLDLSEQIRTLVHPKKESEEK